MKKFAATLFLVCSCLFAIAQNSNTLTFLGIPVDGSKQDMEAQLKQKGFKEKYGYDCLTGQFNGETVDVYIHTNHQIVDRIYVAFLPTTEHEIRFKYNRLLTQFKNNSKYSENFCDNVEIPMDEDISYEISINHKRYEANFAFIKSPDLDEIVEKFMETILTSFSSILPELPEEQVIEFEKQFTEFRALLTVYINSSEEERESMKSRILEDNTVFLNEHPESQELFELVELVKEYLESVLKLIVMTNNLPTGHVWFTIHKHEKLGKFYIGLYYDNLANRPNGEDL